MPFEGEQWVWVTVERAGVLEQEVIQLEDNSLVYSLPIIADYAPNIYFSAVVVKGPDATEPTASHRVGYLLLNVEHTQQELNISVTPSTEQAGPGGDEAAHGYAGRAESDAVSQPAHARQHD